MSLRIDNGYVVDGIRMTSMEMFLRAVRIYGKKELIITDSKAEKVLRENGHKVRREQ